MQKEEEAKGGREGRRREGGREEVKGGEGGKGGSKGGREREDGSKKEGGRRESGRAGEREGGVTRCMGVLPPSFLHISTFLLPSYPSNLPSYFFLAFSLSSFVFLSPY
jgi:hypothetical protein